MRKGKHGTMECGLALILILLLGLLCTAAAEEAGIPSSLEMTRLMGNGTNLGNTLEACNNGAQFGNTTDDPLYYETFWGQPVTTREMIHGMKAAGFDTLRIPVAWMTNATHLGKGEQDYTISPAYLDRVEEIVSWALAEGMYVIVNDHWDGGWYGMFGSETAATRELAMEAYRGMWAQIAARFAAYDEHLIFEGANEEIGPRFDEDSPLYCRDSVKSYLSDDARYALANQVNQAFVDTVRAAGGHNAERFLLIPGYGTNIAQTCDQRFRMPEDTVEDRLLLSVHCYTPWSYCGSSSAATATKWGTASNLQELADELRMTSKFTGRGIGVVVGEYGALPGADGVMKENAVLYHRFFLDACTAYDLCPLLWDTSGFFVRSELAFSDAEMGALYDEKRQEKEEKDAAAVKRAAEAAMAAAISEAPASFREDAPAVGEDGCVAWIMWSSGDWSVSYSVGDTYDPDAISAGLKTTDAVIDGEGTYTVGLDFTGTENGASSSTAFCAVGISNGEILHPGWAVHIKELKVNGEAYKMPGRPYTTSDDGKCTRVNLFNEWVTALPEDARVLYGPNIGITPTPIDRNDPCWAGVKTIEVTFIYGPKQ